MSKDSSLVSIKLHSDGHWLPGGEDHFDRRNFADKLARIICHQTSPDPMVFAIDGPWGAGKSSVLEMMVPSIREQKLAFFQFNPWRYGAEADLLIEFFDELAKALDESLLKGHEKLADWIRKRPEVLLATAETANVSDGEQWYERLIPGYVKAGAALAKRIASPKVESLYERIDNLLQEKQKRVVIFIDDPDRLDPDDLFSLFKLIKLTAGFRWVTYVLAMDIDAVAKSISKRFGRDDPGDGRAFLDKIVQVPLKLPAISPHKLRTFALTLVRESIDTQGFGVSEADWRKIERTFDLIVHRKLSTPRLAKTYANAVFCAVGMLFGEVNLGDLVAMEGLRVFWPQVYKRLPEWRHLLMRERRMIVLSQIDEVFDEPPSSEEILSLILAGVDEQDRVYLARGLETLFPSLAIKGDIGDGTKEEWEREKCVCAEDYFQRYFSYAVPENDVSDAEIELLKGQLIDSENFYQTLARSCVGARTLTVLQRLRVHRGSIGVKEKQFLISGIMRVAAGWDPPMESGIWNEYLAAVDLVARVCESVPPGDERNSLLDILVAGAPSGVFALSVFRDFQAYQEQARSKSDGADMARVFGNLCIRIFGEFRKLGFPGKWPNPEDKLFMIYHSVDKSEFCNWMQLLIQEDKRVVLRLFYWARSRMEESDWRYLLELSEMVTYPQLIEILQSEFGETINRMEVPPYPKNAPQYVAWELLRKLRK